jgi:hypothetical protein
MAAGSMGLQQGAATDLRHERHQGLAARSGICGGNMIYVARGRFESLPVLLEDLTAGAIFELDGVFYMLTNEVDSLGETCKCVNLSLGKIVDISQSCRVEQVVNEKVVIRT